MSPYADLKTIYTQPPPPFGKEIRKLWALDPEYTNLNNGSYGTPPKAVLQSVFEITQEIESNPEAFHRYGYQERLKNARSQLANMIGAQTDEVYLVTNATTGVGTVLRNFEWEKDDVIIIFSTSYASVSNAAAYLADAPPHPKLIVHDINFPTTHAEIVDSFKALLASPHAQVGPNNKRIAVIDSIISNPGALLPWKEMVKLARDANVYSVVDAAHSIGQEIDINLSESQPDFWTSNCHKWLYAKRSCAVLYIPFRNQHLIKTTVPTSNFYIPIAARNGRPNLLEQFEWVGTQDYSPLLSVNEALKFRSWLGGEHKIHEYTHDLALKGGKRVAEILGTSVMDPDGSVTVSMTNVELPIPASVKGSPELYDWLNHKLIDERKIYSAWFFHNGKWWTRASAQVFNDLEDFDKLGHAWKAICPELVKQFGVSS